MEALQSLVSTLAESVGVPGVSIATIRRGEPEFVGAVGVRDVRTNEPVSTETVFEAASLSKPLMAYAVLQLVEAGLFDLDRPLAHIVGPLVSDDAEASAITARHVLAHTSGLPNWRREQQPLRSHFSPGTRFSYSGEGFVYLQSALEAVMAETLEGVMTKLVFEPLGMERSSYIWHKGFDRNFSAPHDQHGRAGDKFRPNSANAAYSLHSTASDYGRFVAAAMSGARLSRQMLETWLAPQVHVPAGTIEALDADPPKTDPEVASGLGWGLEPAQGTFFHWGANSGATAFVIGAPAQQSALVLMANSDAGLRLVRQIVDAVLPGGHPALSWLGLV